MKVNIQSIACNLKKEVSDFIHKRAKKITRFYREIIGIEVSLKVDNSGTKNNKVCLVRLVVPGNDLLSGARCKSFEEATVQALTALQRQIEKRKTKAGKMVANGHYFAL